MRALWQWRTKSIAAWRTFALRRQLMPSRRIALKIGKILIGNVFVAE
jgi:hypothetical protein